MHTCVYTCTRTCVPRNTGMHICAHTCTGTLLPREAHGDTAAHLQDSDTAADKYPAHRQARWGHTQETGLRDWALPPTAGSPRFGWGSLCQTGNPDLRWPTWVTAGQQLGLVLPHRGCACLGRVHSALPPDLCACRGLNAVRNLRVRSRAPQTFPKIVLPWIEWGSTKWGSAGRCAGCWRPG